MTAMSVISGPISHGRLKPRSSRESAKGRAALGEGIKLGDQGNFHRDQGMPLSSAIWPLPGDNPKSRLTISQACRRKKLVCRARGGVGALGSVEEGDANPRSPCLQWARCTQAARRHDPPCHRKARNADRFASTGSGERFPHARRAFRMDKGRPRARDRLRRLEYLAAPFSPASIAFSVVFLWQRDYSNQFCLNQFKKHYLRMNI